MLALQAFNTNVMVWQQVVKQRLMSLREILKNYRVFFILYIRNIWFCCIDRLNGKKLQNSPFSSSISISIIFLFVIWSYKQRTCQTLWAGRGEKKVKHVLDSKMQPLLAAREREKELRGRGWIVSQVRMLFKCKDNSDNSRFIHFSEVREQ